jgi:hypothetical protein
MSSLNHRRTLLQFPATGVLDAALLNVAVDAEEGANRRSKVPANSRFRDAKTSAKCTLIRGRREIPQHEPESVFGL